MLFMEVLRADLNGGGVQDIRSAAQALFIGKRVIPHLDTQLSMGP
jgi:hypothetical protein